RLERCPSGLRSVPGKHVYGSCLYRGFESRPLRHIELRDPGQPPGSRSCSSPATQGYLANVRGSQPAGRLDGFVACISACTNAASGCAPSTRVDFTPLAPLAPSTIVSGTPEIR